MKKIPIRSNHRANSTIAFQSIMGQFQCQSSQQCLDQLGKDRALQMLYNENTKYDVLFSEYQTFLTQDKSLLFEWGYMLDSKFVLCLGSHISFCHLDDGPQLFPWSYINRGIYLADMLWYTDEEIFEDIKSLTTVEFLTKYW